MLPCRRDAEIGLKIGLPEDTSWKSCPANSSLETGHIISDLHTELLQGVVEGQQLQWHMILVER